jgi:ankyrin repeat protein
MEPLTILSAAAAASAVAGKSYKLVNWIRELCQGVKTVDERIQRLKSGVSELARACESVHAALQPDSSSTPLTPPWDKDGSLAISISHQASNCRRTLKELEEVLTDLRPGKSSRISRHISARISTHTNALQMSLQIATIKIALATPDFVIRELREALRDMRRLLCGTKDRNHGPLRLGSVKGEDEDQLVGLAQDALRRGTTLYEASVAGSTVGADSVMGSEQAVPVGKWIHETIGAAQDMYAARTARFYLPSGARNPRIPSAYTLGDYAISEASMSLETASEAASSSYNYDDDTYIKPLPAPGVKSASSNLRRPPPKLSRPLDQMDRAEIVSQFSIKYDGKLEDMICAWNNVEYTFSHLLISKDIAEIVAILTNNDALCKRRNKLALHFAVLFQHPHLVEALVGLGYSPNFSAQISDIEPLSGLRTPIEIAIASHSKPITKVLLKHGAQLNPKHGNSPMLQLFAPSSLNLWPTTDVDAYTGILHLLLSPSQVVDWIDSERPLLRSFLHQICDLPSAWSHLRRPLIMFAFKCLFFSSPLHTAVLTDDFKLLDFVLKTSGSHFLAIHLRRKDRHGHSPLGKAIARVIAQPQLSLDITRILLERGASLDDTSRGSERKLRKLWGPRWRETSLRDIAKRSDRVDLKDLVEEHEEWEEHHKGLRAL